MNVSLNIGLVSGERELKNCVSVAEHKRLRMLESEAKIKLLAELRGSGSICEGKGGGTINISGRHPASGVDHPNTLKVPFPIHP